MRFAIAAILVCLDIVPSVRAVRLVASACSLADCLSSGRASTAWPCARIACAAQTQLRTSARAGRQRRGRRGYGKCTGQYPSEVQVAERISLWRAGLLGRGTGSTRRALRERRRRSDAARVRVSPPRRPALLAVCRFGAANPPAGAPGSRRKTPAAHPARGDPEFTRHGS